MATASVGATTSRALEPQSDPSPKFLSEASSSSSSRTAEAEARQVWCHDGADADVLDLDSPWVAAAEAELRLEEAAMDGAAAGLRLHARDEADEDEIRNNQERQDDELMALEAIYGDDLVELENKGGLRYFQIFIRYDLHDDAEVCAKLSSANKKTKCGACPDDDATKEHNVGSDEFSYTCNFEYLPPLILTCLFPKSYPSKEPPYFTVTSKWMDEPNVSQLCEMLDTIWAELTGQEVVYQWVEWIHNSSLLHLWFDGKIMLGQDTPTYRRDRRAISRSLSLESTIPSMLTYSSKKHYQAFLDDLHTCMICLNQTKGSNFIKLPCHHLFCMKCMETLCSMHVKEGTLFQLVCPDAKCNTSIPHYLLKRLLNEEEFERWDRLALEKALDSMADVVYCPKCVIACVEDEDNTAQCPQCSFTFCGFCKELWHPGKQCLNPEQKLQRRKASGRMTEKEVAQELLNIKELYKDVRLCPNCRIAIAKSEGCNKMVCSNCGQFFCFRCGKAIAGYDHFRNCRLFEARDTAEWEREMDQLQFGNQMRNMLKPLGAVVRCPRCREKTFKDDEKFVFCWACRASICTLCKQTVEDKRLKRGHWGSPDCVRLAES
ncbi:uncharacterized protein [Lolium perenne]|uniref:uncharacterized protein n=1 Tax=Lolium perenne TaxID=4522 RepID=UPI0021F640AC|nr:uncharacterized protein LOC127336398 [Lolium perenne]